MTIISVYAKAGLSIPANRLIRLTGNRTGPLWEVDLPGAIGKRAHGVSSPGTGGVITDKVYGQVVLFGPLVDVELEAAVDFDDDLTVAADGRARKAAKTNRNRSAVALAKMAGGSMCPVLLGWSQLP